MQGSLTLYSINCDKPKATIAINPLFFPTDSALFTRDIHLVM